MSYYDAVVLGGVSAAMIVLKKGREKQKNRKIWMKKYLKNRTFGILRELQEDDDISFKNFTRMTKKSFYVLLKTIEPKIKKSDTFFRQAIPTEIKLAITLRYLATGDSFMTLMYLFRVSKQFISSMLPEMLRAIIDGLQEYMKLPHSEAQWKAIAKDFETHWNFPHCIGALDGKHAVILRTENTVGELYNYKGTNSIVLMAIVDANYNFIYANAGCQGRISDGGIFRNTLFHRKLENNELNLPSDEPLRGRTMPVPYTLVSDDAFTMTPNLMKPYKTALNRGSPNRVFNYRLSRARRIVENTFGLLASVFRIFRKPIEVKVENTVVDIVLACVHLHNFLRSKPDSTLYYSPPGCFDTEDVSTGQIMPGSWRDVTLNDTGLIPLRAVPRRPFRIATKIRDEFNNYFMSPEGFLSFQTNYL